MNTQMTFIEVVEVGPPLDPDQSEGANGGC